MKSYIFVALLVTTTQAAAQQDERSQVTKEQQESTLSPQPPVSSPQPPKRREPPITNANRPTNPPLLVPPRPLPPQYPVRPISCYDLPISIQSRCTDTREYTTYYTDDDHHRRPVTPWQCMQVSPNKKTKCLRQIQRETITPKQRREIQRARQEFRRKVNNILQHR